MSRYIYCGNCGNRRSKCTCPRPDELPVSWEEVGEAEIGRLGQSVAHVWAWTGDGFRVQIKTPDRRLRTFRSSRPFALAKALAERELRLAERDLAREDQS